MSDVMNSAYPDIPLPPAAATTPTPTVPLAGPPLPPIPPHKPVLRKDHHQTIHHPGGATHPAPSQLPFTGTDLVVIGAFALIAIVAGVIGRLVSN